MKKTIIILFALALTSCVDRIERKVPYSPAEAQTLNSSEENPEQAKEKVNKVLEDWHRAAAEADFDGYFGKMAEPSVYIGTDATENWDLEAFKAFSKPYFDNGKAWDFTSLERNIYLSESGNVAWFDELLDSHMGLTRGSGVLVRRDDTWKIKHYVLSLTIPNDNLEQVKAVNREIDSSLISGYKVSIKDDNP